MKALTTIPKDRLKRYGVEIPDFIDLEVLDKNHTREDIIEKVKDVDFLFVSLTKVDKEIIDAGKKLKLIQSEGVGYNGIDVDYAREKGIYVCNAKGVNKDSVAELTLGLIIASQRGILSSNNSIMAGEYVKYYKEYEDAKVRPLTSSHVGLLGMGDIGEEVVRRLKAFGCKISYNNRSRKLDIEEKYNISYLEQEEIFKECDIISVHMPLTKDTKHIINKDSLKLMKKNAIVINTSRGDLVNQEDLAEAIKNEEIFGAGIDTFSPEPPGSDHPLLNLGKYQDRAVLTTHIAGITGEDFAQMQRIGFNNMERIYKGKKPKNIVNGL